MRLHFMNRTREITKLTRVLGSHDPSLVVIYGRRRCGKSTLLQHVAKKTDIYFLADQQESPLQIQSLAIEIGRTIPDFEQANYPSWEALLSVLQHQAKKGTTLIIDEFPYLVQKSPELPSIIQKLKVNAYWKPGPWGSVGFELIRLILETYSPEEVVGIEKKPT